MEFSMAFNNETRKHIIDQVFQSVLENFPITQDDVESMEVYVETTLTIILNLKKGGIIEIDNIYTDSGWGFIQWDHPEMRH
jgi:hypothetical protein